MTVKRKQRIQTLIDYLYLEVMKEKDDYKRELMSKALDKLNYYNNDIYLKPWDIKSEKIKL